MCVGLPFDVNMQRPQHYALITGLARVVRAVAHPETHFCDARADEVMGSGWRNVVYPPSTRTVPLSATQKQLVAAKWKKLSEHVTEALGEGSLRKMKGKAWETLVYGVAMEPENPIIKAIMDRLFKESDHSSTQVSKHGKVTTLMNLRACEQWSFQVLFGMVRRHVYVSGNERGLACLETEGRGCHNFVFFPYCILNTISRNAFLPPIQAWHAARGPASTSPKPQCIGALFGLLRTTQADPALAAAILEKGIGNSVRILANEEARLDILRMIALSLAGGELRHGVGIRDEYGHEVAGVAALLPSLVSPEDQARFEADDGRLKAQVLGVLKACWNTVVPALGEKRKYVGAINKKPLVGKIGSLNKTVLAPATGESPHISTSSVYVVFDQAVMAAFLLFEGTQERDREQCKMARQLGVEVCVLCIDRVLPNFTKFEKFWNALDETSWLKEILRKDPCALSRNGEPFFDDARLSVMSSERPETGEGNRGEAGGGTKTGKGESEDRGGEALSSGNSPGILSTSCTC